MNSNDLIQSDPNQLHSENSEMNNNSNESSQSQDNLSNDFQECTNQIKKSNLDEDSLIVTVQTQQEILEQDIFRRILQKQKKRNPFQQQLIGDILHKLKQIEGLSRQKTGEDLITLRIQEVVYNKLLVMSYAASQFRLVKANYKLGIAYLKNQCIDQAVEHLINAISKNQKLFQEIPKTSLFQSSVQNVLGECLMRKQEYSDAIQILLQSISVASSVVNEEDFLFGEETSNKARILLAQCYCKQRQFQQAISIIDEVLESRKGLQGRVEDYAFGLVEKAKILSLKDDNAQAVTAQQQAINLLIQANYPKPQEVAEMYEKLGQYFDRMGNAQNSLECVQKVKTLYQQIYSAEDKRVLKARRKIATSFLKNERFKQAINQLLDILQLEEKLFGQSSIQIARTLKLLGIVYLSIEASDGRLHLRKALTIFNSHGNKKQAQEVKEKLKVFNSGHSNQQQLKMLSEQDL